MTDDNDEMGQFPPFGRIGFGSLSLMVHCETPEEVREAFEALREGGEVITPMHATSYSSAFVSLRDRFGMRWEIMTEN